MKTNKKLLSLTLCITILLSVFSFMGNAIGSFLPVFSITVDGFTFNSDEDSSGEGWSYSSSERSLTLDSYNGSSVISSGDLKIYLANDNVISGTVRSEYSPESCGIYAKENLEIFVAGNSIISGASSSTKGGEAIIAANVSITSNDNASLILNGADRASAIKADTLTLDCASIAAKGGKNASAVYYASSFSISESTEAIFTSGSTDRYAITYLAGASAPTYDEDKMAVIFEASASTVVLKATDDIIYGDINLSGVADSADAVLLAQFFAKWDVKFTASSFAAADVCLDKIVDSKDAVRLAQYFAQWDVKLGE